MNKILFGLVLMAGIGSAGQRAADYKGEGQMPDSVRRVIDSGIVLLRTHALHRDRPDWDYVRARAYELAGQANRWEDLGPAVSWLFEAVDDHHGWLVVKDTKMQWLRQDQPHLSEALKQELEKGPRMVKQLLPGGIGYLRVPGMFIGLRDSLSALAAEGARKYIIDLRLTTGDMMIEGLSSLSGGHGMYAGSPVVVLTGHGTSGTGEYLVVSFKGREHTWSIGEPTAGNARGNVHHWIVEGQVGIVIAETAPMDRDHHYYPGPLIPDEWVPGGDDFSDPGKDKKIQAAVKKLRAASREL